VRIVARRHVFYLRGRRQSALGTPATFIARHAYGSKRSWGSRGLSYTDHDKLGVLYDKRETVLGKLGTVLGKLFGYNREP